MLTLREAPANSFHTSTPQRIATTGAALLRAYEIAGPAAPTAMKLALIPVAQIAPPSTPVRCVVMLPLKYSAKWTGAPSTGLRMKKGLKRKVVTNAPSVKKNDAVRGISLPPPPLTNTGSVDRTTNP